MTSTPPFLDVKDVRKQYGAIKAVDGVTFSVGPGEIVRVIGPNGTGKTTLFNSILGQIRPTSGHVAFCGEDITGMSPLNLSRRGIGRTFQTLQVFGKLSVRDNLIVAAQEFKGSLGARLFGPPDAGLGEHADRMIEMFRLKHVAHLPAGSLSINEVSRRFNISRTHVKRLLDKAAEMGDVSWNAGRGGGTVRVSQRLVREYLHYQAEKYAIIDTAFHRVIDAVVTD